jgi:hypothetical protein
MAKPGPKNWRPTDEERRLVEHYVSIGYTQEQIGALIANISRCWTSAPAAMRDTARAERSAASSHPTSKASAPLRRHTLAGFVREAWHILEPTQRYVHNWHIDAICQHLEAVTAGRVNRLLINVPPGSSKSLIVSVLWPAWEWGPKGLRSLRYLATSFNEGPVKRDTRKHRDLTMSDWYRALWPMSC